MQPSSNDTGFQSGDRDLLIRISERVAAMDRRMAKVEKALNGNGNPGLITRVAKVETRLIIISAIVLAALAGAGGILAI